MKKDYDTLRRIVTAEELSEKLSLHPETIRRHVRAGNLPFIRLGRGVIRFDLEAVIAALGSPEAGDGRPSAA
jgi:excisionase family DNA binding protein